jgi:O-antigen biosynthesis protein WbqP
MKRAIDILASLLGLLIFAPILAVAALAICLESRGSPIFAQTRIGQKGQFFRCFKLRTMYEKTPTLPTHQVEESAVTRVGARLRRWKLDELPQFLNVLLGQMSIVGPRPCLPVQTELIEARRRLGVLDARPGITGLAQVREIDMSDPERLAQVDAEYLRTRTFVIDLELVLATILGSGRGVDRVRSSPGERFRH